MSRLRKIAYYIGLTAGVILFGQQLFVGFNGFVENRDSFNAVNIIAGISCIGVSYVLQMWMWQVLMAGLGVSIGGIEVIRGYLLSFIPRYIPGTVWGYVSRNEWLKQNFNVSYVQSSFGSVLEVSIWVFTSIILALACLLWFSYGLWWVSLFWLASGWILIWFFWDVVHKITSYPLFSNSLNRFLPGLQTKIQIKYWVTAYFICVAFWISHGLALLSFLQGVNLEMGDLVKTTFIYTIAWLVGFLVLIAPAGLGIREVVLSNLLVSLFSLPIGFASTLAVIYRFGIYLAEIIWIVLGFLAKVPISESKRDK